MKYLASLLCLLCSLSVSAAPEVRVQNRLVGADSAVVGGTVQMQVDVLVDTWLTAAPQLPTLELQGAVVASPNGEATHLTEQQDGKTFFGLRFLYLITPQLAQRFDIPALAIQVEAGQGSGTLTIQSQPQSFSAQALEGMSDERVLVARQVELTQEITPSHVPLRVGDSVTRRVHVRAEGAQALLIPPPAFVEINGLKRYVQTPDVHPLSDGRGGVIGGARDDAVTYVVSEAGDFRLPAIALSWWDLSAGMSRSLAADAFEFQVRAASGYQAPFSIDDYLRALNRQVPLRLSGHWPLQGGALLVVALGLFVGRRWVSLLLAAVRRWRKKYQRRWLESPEFAWRLAKRQLSARPAQLSGLYLWLRRCTGRRGMSGALAERSVAAGKAWSAFLGARYGREHSRDATEAPETWLPELKRRVTGQTKAARSRAGLKSLNP